MKRLIITFLAATAFGLGCKPAAETPTNPADNATAKQFTKAKAATKEAAYELKEYAYAEKVEFVAKMQSQLDEIKRLLDQLSSKIEKSSDAAKAEAKPKLEALREQAAKLDKQLGEAKNANESTWDDAKTGFTNGYAELKDWFRQARQWVSEKIAP